MVSLGDILLEVETDKAVLEVECAASGVLLGTLFEPDTVVTAGTVIAYLGKAGEALPEAAAVGGHGGPPLHVSGEPTVKPTIDGLQSGGGRMPLLAPGVLALPAVRKLARDLGVDIDQVHGTGLGGRTSEDDVRRAVIGVGHAGRPTTEMVRSRRAAAAQYEASWRSIPRISLTVSVDMTAARTALERHRAGKPSNVNYTHVLLRAIAAALRENPNANQVWDDAAGAIGFSSVNVCLAVACDDLVRTVAIHEPDSHDLGEVAALAQTAAQRARAGRLTQTELAPCAMTLSNLGMFGIEQFDALIPPGQCGILAAGVVADEVMAHEGGIHVRPRMRLTLCVDHRVLDGGPAATFLAAVKKNLESL